MCIFIFIIYATEDRNGAVWHKFTVSETSTSRGRKECASVFASKATTKGLAGPEKGRQSDIDAVVLYVVRRVLSGCQSQDVM